MRYNINLATRPYVDAQRFYTDWLAGLVPLFLLATALVGFAVHALVSSREVAQAVRKVEGEITRLDAQRARAQQVMDRPENRDTRMKSQFLNQAIARKTFSWTRVFEELERVMPPRVHVVSIRPETRGDQTRLVMTVAADTRENAVELLRKMEASESFRQPELVSEDLRQTQSGGSQVEFQVSAKYVPQPLALPSAAAMKGGN
ncbi:MAG: PilN domain-containing protein [Candidatus Koribacter versatilis]|uniref:PilN domain-containing protein n=1 Tax=Candidatus Korobacter versatilis TaxID=658062 RepID=A0A932A6A9_9BACT|nr:PilN domain-containing protein [Candidatus Koribacter versatilis]